MTVPTPESLVRARYTAYIMHMPDFLIKTTHPDNDDYKDDREKWRMQLKGYMFRTTFDKLEILDAHDNEVRYRMHIYEFHLDPATVTETCQFARIDGQWRYLSGEIDYVKETN